MRLRVADLDLLCPFVEIAEHSPMYLAPGGPNRLWGFLFVLDKTQVDLVQHIVMLPQLTCAATRICVLLSDHHQQTCRQAHHKILLTQTSDRGTRPLVLGLTWAHVKARS